MRDGGGYLMFNYGKAKARGEWEGTVVGRQRSQRKEVVLYWNMINHTQAIFSQSLNQLRKYICVKKPLYYYIY